MLMPELGLAGAVLGKAWRCRTLRSISLPMPGNWFASSYHLDTYPALQLVVDGASGDVTQLAPDTFRSSKEVFLSQ